MKLLNLKQLITFTKKNTLNEIIKICSTTTKCKYCNERADINHILTDCKNEKLKEKRLEYIGLKSLRIYEDSRIDPRKEYTRKAPLELVILAAYCRNDISKHAINVAKQSIMLRDKYEKNNIIARLV